MLDFSAVERTAEWESMGTVLQAVRACNLVPLAFRGEPGHWTKQLLCSQLLYITSVVPAILPSISAFATSVQPVPLGLEDQEEIHSVMIDPDHHQ